MHKKKLKRKVTMKRRGAQAGATATAALNDLRGHVAKLNALVTQLKEYTPAIREKVTLVRDALRAQCPPIGEQPRAPMTVTDMSALADHLDYALNKLVTF